MAALAAGGERAARRGAAGRRRLDPRALPAPARRAARLAGASSAGSWRPLDAPDGTLVYERRSGDDRRRDRWRTSARAGGARRSASEWTVEVATDRTREGRGVGRDGRPVRGGRRPASRGRSRRPALPPRRRGRRGRSRSERRCEPASSTIAVVHERRSCRRARGRRERRRAEACCRARTRGTRPRALPPVASCTRPCSPSAARSLCRSRRLAAGRTVRTEPTGVCTTIVFATASSASPSSSASARALSVGACGISS